MAPPVEALIDIDTSIAGEDPLGDADLEGGRQPPAAAQSAPASERSRMNPSPGRLPKPVDSSARARHAGAIGPARRTWSDDAMRCSLAIAVIASACATAPVSSSDDGLPPAGPEDEVAAARALFERNLAAIQAKDREAYLACYRPSERLVRSTAAGVELGYDALAESTPATGAPEWPESLEANELTVHWVRPGVVFGAYAYRVVFDGVETVGRSERLFIREGGQWVIAVSTAFATPPDAND